MADHFIQHIPDSQLISRRNRMGFSNTQVIELIGICHIFFIIVYFVDSKNNRLMRTAEHVCHLPVGIHHPLLYIHHKDDYICRVHSNLRLFTHLGKNHILTVRLNATGIDQCKCPIQPRHICIDSVSGDSRRILYN